MKYSSPPVVEVAITINFNPSDMTLGWSKETAVEFIEKFECFHKPEYVLNHNITISNTESDVSYEHTIKEVYAKNKEETEILGVGKNYLTFHKIRRGKDYPHYTPVVQKVIDYLPIYKEFWRPEKMQRLTLSYVDIIEIPEVEFDFDKYFKIGVKFPEEIGEVDQLETHLVFQPKEKYDMNLDLQFSKLFSSDKSRTCFYLFWNCTKKISEEHCFLNEMDGIHDFTCKIFEYGLTEDCKKLFDMDLQK